MKYILEDENKIQHLLKFDSLDKIEKAATLTDDKYKEIRKPLEPLPNRYYKNRLDGSIFSQFHVRGILSDDKKAFDENEKSFQEVIIGRSLHQDLRLKLKGLSKLVQFVITESDMPSYIRGMLGELNPEQKGAPSPQKCKVIFKPSAAEPQKIIKTNEKDKEILIDKKGAEIVDNYILHSKSYWISPGQVGRPTIFITSISGISSPMYNISSGFKLYLK